jgi:hypothetical protein
MATATQQLDLTATFSKRLSDNPPVFAQRSEAGDPARHNGVLIGNFKDEMLLIGGFTTVEMRVGERIILRMVLGNLLVGFETQVVKRYDDPQMYLVKFPLHVESINLRKSQRIQAFFPAEVQVSKQASGTTDMYLLKTRVLDISAGGCSFRSKTKLVSGADVKISFSLPGDRQIQSVLATIIECSPAGVAFHNRTRFSQDPANLPILQEIGKWIAESLTFTG